MNVAFVCQLFHEILRLSPRAITHFELSVESLCMDLAPFVSDNAREVNRIQEQQRLQMIHQGEDQKIISAWSGQIAQQRKDRMGAQVFRVDFEAACLQRIGIR
jgi:predicted Zn-dependent protease